MTSVTTSIEVVRLIQFSMTLAAVTLPLVRLLCWTRVCVRQFRTAVRTGRTGRKNR